jgi:CheY-like chemotaxis protein
MDRYVRNVLIVESDSVERERLAATLEGNGFEVVLCPGPTAPITRASERGSAGVRWPRTGASS